MVKKEWNNPECLNLGVERTEGGGIKPEVHDGKWINVGGIDYEGVGKKS